MTTDPAVVAQSLEIVRTVVEGLIGVAAPYIAWKIAKLEGQGDNQQARAVIESSLDKGTDLALDYGIAAGDPLLLKEANKHAALNTALQYVTAHTDDEAKLLNVSEAALGVKVQAALAGKLHPSIVAAMPVASVSPPVDNHAATPTA